MQQCGRVVKSVLKMDRKLDVLIRVLNVIRDRVMKHGYARF